MDAGMIGVHNGAWCYRVRAQPVLDDLLGEALVKVTIAPLVEE
jgi:hypothetical protein